MKRKYTLKADYFKVIDSEQKAYWLGFIQADGAIDGPRENQLRIKLQKSDRCILERFIQDIGWNGPIKERLNYCAINITSKELTDDLKKLGIVRNKTFKTEYLTLLHHQNHYFRGLFDGDGCACYYIDKKKRHVLCVSLAVNPTTGIQIVNSFNKMSVNFRTVVKTNIVEIQTTKWSNLQVIYKYLYGSYDFCLQRKKDKFDSYFKYKEGRSSTIIATPTIEE